MGEPARAADVHPDARLGALVIDVGDIICTRNPKGWPAYLIRLGAAILDKPNTVNHVIVAHHVDEAGTFWGVEGRPGGVGWVDMRRALKAPYTLTNAAQPKTLEQRLAIAKVVEGMLGTPYDWAGIVGDAMDAIHAQNLWASQWGEDRLPPSHVVCSSLADWVYEHVGLASPAKDRNVTPGDWAAFITERGWE